RYANSNAPFRNTGTIGMSRIKSCIAKLKEQNRAAIMTFFTADDSEYDTAMRIFKYLPEECADGIALCIHFTDPLTHVPAIQLDNIHSLKNGHTLRKTLQMVTEFRKDNQHTPVVLMGYFNPIHHYGVPSFIEDAKNAGVDGLIV